MWKKFLDYMDSYGFEFESESFFIKITNKTLWVIAISLLIGMAISAIRNGVCN